MGRVLCVGLLIVTAGCQLPPEQAPIRPLPEDSAPLPYAELLTRARLQAMTATEAFYVNEWGDLEDTAKALAQTARFLGKAIEVPTVRRDTLVADSEQLTREAETLRDAAKSRDVKGVNGALQRIHLKVRQLRPEN